MTPIGSTHNDALAISPEQMGFSRSSEIAFVRNIKGYNNNPKQLFWGVLNGRWNEKDMPDFYRIFGDFMWKESANESNDRGND